MLNLGPSDWGRGVLNRRTVVSNHNPSPSSTVFYNSQLSTLVPRLPVFSAGGRDSGPVYERTSNYIIVRLLRKLTEVLVEHRQLGEAVGKFHSNSNTLLAIDSLSCAQEGEAGTPGRVV